MGADRLVHLHYLAVVFTDGGIDWRNVSSLAVSAYGIKAPFALNTFERLGTPIIEP